MKRTFIILCVAMPFMHCTLQQDSEAEEMAIKQLLEKESATWRSGDIKGHAECWYIQPYSKILVSAGDGTVIDVPPPAMIDPPAGAAGQGGSSSNSNYKISIQGNFAWVSHDEVSSSKEGNKTYSSEIRILEKIEGAWKLVGQSIHIDKRKIPDTASQ